MRQRKLNGRKIILKDHVLVRDFPSYLAKTPLELESQKELFLLKGLNPTINYSVSIFKVPAGPLLKRPN